MLRPPEQTSTLGTTIQTRKRKREHEADAPLPEEGSASSSTTTGKHNLSDVGDENKVEELLDGFSISRIIPTSEPPGDVSDHSTVDLGNAPEGELDYPVDPMVIDEDVDVTDKTSATSKQPSELGDVGNGSEGTPGKDERMDSDGMDTTSESIFPSRISPRRFYAPATKDDLLSVPDSDVDMDEVENKPVVESNQEPEEGTPALDDTSVAAVDNDNPAESTAFQVDK